ncbi:hypothetical protein ACFL16_00905 [Patescibacteria group bacterium]
MNSEVINIAGSVEIAVDDNSLAKNRNGSEFNLAAIELYAILIEFTKNESVAKEILKKGFIKNGELHISFPGEIRRFYLLKRKYSIKMTPGSPNKLFCELGSHKIIRSVNIKLPDNLVEHERNHLDKFLRVTLIRKRKRGFEDSVRRIMIFYEKERLEYGFRIVSYDGRRDDFRGFESISKLKRSFEKYFT